MEGLYTQEILKNKQNRYEHITKRERDIISKHLSAGKRISYIAKALNRSKSSISEEIKGGWYKVNMLHLLPMTGHWWRAKNRTTTPNGVILIYSISF